MRPSYLYNGVLYFGNTTSLLCNILMFFMNSYVEAFYEVLKCVQRLYFHVFKWRYTSRLFKMKCPRGPYF